MVGHIPVFLVQKWEELRKFESLNYKGEILVVEDPNRSIDKSKETVYKRTQYDAFPGKDLQPGEPFQNGSSIATKREIINAIRILEGVKRKLQKLLR